MTATGWAEFYRRLYAKTITVQRDHGVAQQPIGLGRYLPAVLAELEAGPRSLPPLPEHDPAPLIAAADDADDEMVRAYRRAKELRRMADYAQAEFNPFDDAHGSG